MLTVALGGLFATGCMTAPTDGKELRRNSEAISVGGLNAVANEPIQFRACSTSTGNCTNIGSTRSETSPTLTDGAGMRWYSWHEPDVRLPSRSYWTSRGSGTNRYTDIRVQATGSSSGATMKSFTVEGGQCALFLGYAGLSGFDIMNYCGSGSSATLRVPCGGRAESCCYSSSHNGYCDSGLRCDTGICVPPTVDIRIAIGTDDPDVVNPRCPEADGMPCVARPSNCTSGFTSFPSVIECVGSQPVCQVDQPGDDGRVRYCTVTSNEEECGGWATAQCSEPSQCMPGLTCSDEATAVNTGMCERNDMCSVPGGYCWEPRDGSYLMMNGPKAGGGYMDGCR